MQINIFLCCAIIFAIFPKDISGCLDYKARILKIKNCNGTDSVMTVDPDITVKLSKNCELVPKGCVTTKAFNKAKVTFKVTKDGVKIAEGTKDMCKEIESASEHVKQMLDVLSIPKQCPVSEAKLCADDKRISIAKQKNMLPMAKGKTRAELFFQHDTGTSCIIIEVEIYK